MPLKDSATEAKLVLEQALRHPIQDACGHTIRWTPGQARLLEQIVSNLEFDLSMSDLAPLNEPETYTDG